MTILNAAENDTWSSGASFTLSNRLYRLAWNVSWALLASWTPPPFHRWRRFLLRLFGAKVASTAGVYGSAKIWSPANFEIGEHAYVGPRATIYSMAKITMGPYSLVSQGGHVCAGTHDIEDVHFQLGARPVHIGARVWIAAEAFVGPGVTVGDGVVLGARACAMKDLDPWTVYSGNPAKAVRPRRVRFPETGQAG